MKNRDEVRNAMGDVGKVVEFLGVSVYEPGREPTTRVDFAINV